MLSDQVRVTTTAARVSRKAPRGEAMMLVLARPVNMMSLVISEKFLLIFEFQIWSISGK